MKYRMEEERENVRREGNEEEKGKEGRRDNEKKNRSDSMQSEGAVYDYKQAYKIQSLHSLLVRKF